MSLCQQAEPHLSADHLIDRNANTEASHRQILKRLNHLHFHQWLSVEPSAIRRTGDNVAMQRGNGRVRRI